MSYFVVGARESGRIAASFVVCGVLVAGAVLASSLVWSSSDEVLDHLRAGNAGEPDAFEPNDSFATAAVLGSEESITVGATIHAVGDEDHYLLTPPKTGIEVLTVYAGVTDVDVLLLLDDTGSFSTVGPSLVAEFPTLVADLAAAYPGSSFAFGVARFEDYANVGGYSNDRPFILSQPVIRSDDPAFDSALSAALARTSPGGGGDLPESAIEALYQIATGAGFDGNDNGNTTDSGPAGSILTQTTPGTSGDVPAFSSFVPDPTPFPAGPVVSPSGDLGGVGFRSDAARIVIVATDIGFAYQPDAVDPYIGHDGVTVPASQVQASGRDTTPFDSGAGIQETIDALNSLGAQVVGLGTVFNGTPRGQLEALATLTGALNWTATSIDSGIPGDFIEPGEPLYFYINPDDPSSIRDALFDGVDSSIARRSGTKMTVRDVLGNVIASSDSFAFTPEISVAEVAIPVVAYEPYFVEISASFAPVAYVLDALNQGVSQPWTPVLDPSSDTRGSNSDGITDDTTPRVLVELDLADFDAWDIDILNAAQAGTGVHPGVALRVRVENTVTGVSFTGYANPVGTSVSTFDFTVDSPLDDGTYLLDAAAVVFDQQQDASGQSSPAVGRGPGSPPLIVIIDTTPGAAVGNRVWHDLDGDGVQDPGEPGYPDVVVSLFVSDGTPVGPPLLTDSSGEFWFTDLPPGDYYVGFTAPSGMVFSPPHQGGNDTTDSDADPVSGLTPVFTLSDDEIDGRWDAGLVPEPTGRIGNIVWHDLDGDGVQDPGEPGYPDVVVSLFASDGTPVGPPLLTDSSGEFWFTDLSPGDYFVGFTTPFGMVFSPPHQGGDDNTDSDADPVSGLTPAFTLSDDEIDGRWDAGLVPEPTGRIGNIVWHDLDGDGVQDPGEPGYPDVVVSLFASDATPVGTPMLTDSSGQFWFIDLPPGEYYVGFTAPSGMVFSPPHQGGDDTADSDADPVSGLTPALTLSDGEIDGRWDAGLMPEPAGRIGNIVWHDLDGDGVQDPGEPGYPDVVVSLFASGATPVGTPMLTDSSGEFWFTDLPPGDYFVGFTTPPGMAFSPPHQGGDDTTDSDADPVSGLTPALTLSDGEIDGRWDAGLVPVPESQIGNTVWLDRDGDGVQGATENGIGGIEIRLRESGGALVAETVSGDDGSYAFQVPSGNYYLEVHLATESLTLKDVGLEDVADSDFDPSTGATVVFTVAAGVTDDSWDLGLVPQVGGRVWAESDNDGIREPGEPAGSGVEVQLYNQETLIATTLSNADGFYAFASLPPDTYFLEVVPPGNLIFVPMDQGPDDAVDSDVDPESGRTPFFDYALGGYSADVDAGLSVLLFNDGFESGSTTQWSLTRP